MERVNRTLRTAQLAALVAVLLGGGGSVVAWLTEPEQFWPSYHVSYLFWWQITMGFLGLTLLRCIVRSNWGNATWPYLKAGLVTIPVSAVLFIPIGLALASIFPWAQEGWNRGHHPNTFQAVYFEETFFWGRAAAYFVLWLAGGAIALRTGTLTGEARLPRRLASFALIGLVLGSTFAAFDWGMSLETEWYSTIYGALVLMSGGVAAMAILVLSVALLLRLPQQPHFRIRQIMNDLGNMLLAFIMIWSYFAFSQYLIIWSGNLPAEVTWYVQRSTGSWHLILLVVVAFHFVVPFFALISREQKQRPRRMAWIAGILLAANAIQTLWTYGPSFSPGLSAMHWSLVATAVGIGGCWFGAYATALSRFLNSQEMQRRTLHG